MNDPIEPAPAILISLSWVGILSVTGALAWRPIQRWSLAERVLAQRDQPRLKEGA